MLVFGAVGLVANLVGVGILLGSRRADLNLRAAFLEVVNDALGSVAVMVAAAVIATTGWLRADAVASLVIGVLIVPRTCGCCARASTCCWSRRRAASTWRASAST